MKVIALFLKVPVLGTVKTRLAQSLGDEAALAAYRELVEFLLQRLSASQVHVHYTPDSFEVMEAWLGNVYTYRLQQGKDLGERLIHATELEFAAGADKLIFLGGDCPYVDQDRLDEAFAELESHDVVLGPASDGGYYLIGMKRPIPGVFQNIDWGKETVFQSTLERCRHEGLSVALLSEESDVDDLGDWEKAKAFMEQM